MTSADAGRGRRAGYACGRRFEACRAFADAELLSIPGRDHNLAVGDKAFKAGALEFLPRALNAGR